MIDVEDWLAEFDGMGSNYSQQRGCSCSALFCDYADCSEIIKWTLCRAGVSFTDGSWLQYRACRNAGLATTPERAANTRGALLFLFSSNPLVGGRPGTAHVETSLGSDRLSIGCRSSSDGCGTFSGGIRWNYAALVPGIDYSLSMNAPAGAGGDTPPSLVYKPPGAPQPRPTPPLLHPAGAVDTTPVLPSWAYNIKNSAGCFRHKAMLIRDPYGTVGEWWFVNGVFRHRLGSGDFDLFTINGISPSPDVSPTFFDQLLDISDL